MKKAIQIIVSVLLFIACGYYFYHQVNDNKEQLKEILHEIPQLSGHIIISMLLFYVAVAIRAWRWNIMLNVKNTFWVSYRSIAIGYLVQSPLSKLGEVVRITNQISYTDKSKGEIVSTVFVDRLLDFISLATILFLSLILTGDKLEKNFPEIASLAPILGGIVFLGILGLIVFILMRNSILDFLKNTKVFPDWFKNRLVNFASSFITGLSCVKSPKVLFLFLITSILIWICYFISYFVIICFFSFTVNKLDSADIVFSFVCSTLGAIIPVPGGLAYPIAIEKSLFFVLGSEQITKPQALGIGLVCYFCILWIANIINGGISFLYQVFAKKKTT
jgi:glycosyltransferase 2 family protein